MVQTKIEKQQEGIALLKILDMSTKSKQQGKSKPIEVAFTDIRQDIQIANEAGTISEHQ